MTYLAGPGGVVNGEDSLTSIRCRTSTGNDERKLKFTVVALNAQSAPSIDTFQYPEAPAVVRVIRPFGMLGRPVSLSCRCLAVLTEAIGRSSAEPVAVTLSPLKALASMTLLSFALANRSAPTCSCWRLPTLWISSSACSLKEWALTFPSLCRTVCGSRQAPPCCLTRRPS